MCFLHYNMYLKYFALQREQENIILDIQNSNSFILLNGIKLKIPITKKKINN